MTAVAEPDAEPPVRPLGKGLLRSTSRTPRYGPVRRPMGPLARRIDMVRDTSTPPEDLDGHPRPGLRPRSRGDAAVGSAIHAVLLAAMGAFLWETFGRLAGAHPGALVVYIGLLVGTTAAFVLFAASLLFHVFPVLVGLRAPADPFAPAPEPARPKWR